MKPVEKLRYEMHESAPSRRPGRPRKPDCELRPRSRQVRRYRDRERLGIIVVGTEVSSAMLCAMVEAGELREEQIDDREAVAMVVSRLLMQRLKIRDSN